ncbi:MAG: hypothetical protein JOZ05_24180 [Acetobacteraceae bacterium]|nr:hypothetical protein [Acetobacteraceae bacterium]
MIVTVGAALSTTMELLQFYNPGTGLTNVPLRSPCEEADAADAVKHVTQGKALRRLAPVPSRLQLEFAGADANVKVP